MTKEQINSEVVKYMNLIEELSNTNTFELNPQISEYKKNLAILRNMCDHKNENGEFALTDNHHCLFCLKKIQ